MLVADDKLVTVRGRRPPLRVRAVSGADAAPGRGDATPQGAGRSLSVRLASSASTVLVPEIAVSMSEVRFDVSPRRPPTAAEIVSLAWITSARRTARSRWAAVAREQLGADEHRADAEHPPRVQRRALRRPDPACLERGHEKPHHAVDDADRREEDTGCIAETGLAVPPGVTEEDTR